MSEIGRRRGAMAKFEKGVLLTCPHEGCGCRVRVEEVCDCPGAGDHYTCICGAPMVLVKEES
jgi:metallothionein